MIAKILFVSLVAPVVAVVLVLVKRCKVAETRLVGVERRAAEVLANSR